MLGAHVEGPFINEARIGAHELKVLQASAKSGYSDFKEVYGLEGETPEEQFKLTQQNQNSVKIITCAPELEGIMDSIPDLVKAGITVSVGKVLLCSFSWKMSPANISFRHSQKG